MKAGITIYNQNDNKKKLVFSLYGLLRKILILYAALNMQIHKLLAKLIISVFLQSGDI